MLKLMTRREKTPAGMYKVFEVSFLGLVLLQVWTPLTTTMPTESERT